MLCHPCKSSRPLTEWMDSRNNPLMFSGFLGLKFIRHFFPIFVLCAWSKRGIGFLHWFIIFLTILLFSFFYFSNLFLQLCFALRNFANGLICLVQFILLLCCSMVICGSLHPGPTPLTPLLYCIYAAPMLYRLLLYE